MLWTEGALAEVDGGDEGGRRTGFGGYIGFSISSWDDVCE